MLLLVSQKVFLSSPFELRLSGGGFEDPRPGPENHRRSVVRQCSCCSGNTPRSGNISAGMHKKAKSSSASKPAKTGSCLKIRAIQAPPSRKAGPKNRECQTFTNVEAVARCPQYVQDVFVHRLVAAPSRRGTEDFLQCGHVLIRNDMSPPNVLAFSCVVPSGARTTSAATLSWAASDRRRQVRCSLR
jgi:hypothetical protein